MTDADDAPVIALDSRREQDARPPQFSDEALALRFADLHADEMRFVAAWGKWLTFDGAVWSFDDTERPVNDKKGRLAYGQSRADFPTD